MTCCVLTGTAALEEDAQILKVIEAYCTSAKTRQTLNSSKFHGSRLPGQDWPGLVAIGSLACGGGPRSDTLLVHPVEPAGIPVPGSLHGVRAVRGTPGFCRTPCQGNFKY